MSVDPMLPEARQITAKYYEEHGYPAAAASALRGDYDNGAPIKLLCIALHRGKELADG